jgi:hypothetical protein
VSRVFDLGKLIGAEWRQERDTAAGLAAMMRG